MKFSSPAAALGGLDFDEMATVFEFWLPRALIFDVLPDRRTRNFFPRQPQRYLKSVVISIERLFWMLLWRGFGAPFAWPNQWPGPPATRCSKETATQTSHGNKINVSARHKHRKTPSACVHTRVHTHACVVHTRHAPCALRALSGAYIPPKANLARP